VVKKYSLGNEELDELIGELEPGTILLIEGEPGAGKTTLALSMACRNALERNAKVLYIAFGEAPEKLVKYASSIGLRVEELVNTSKIKIDKIPIVSDKDLIDIVTHSIAEGISNYDIIIVDSITPVMKLLEGYGPKRAWLQTTLYDYVSGSDKLLVFIADRFQREDSDLKLLEFIADVVIQAEYRVYKSGDVERYLIVRKFRGKIVKNSSIPFEVGEGGIVILNYTSSKIAKKYRSSRQPLKIECEILHKILPKVLPPDTEIFIIDRGDLLRNSNLLKYLVIKSLDLAKKGFYVDLTSYESRTFGKIHEIISQVKASKELLSKIRALQLNPLITSTNYISLISVLGDRQYGTFFSIVLNLQRLLDAHPLESIKNMTMYLVQLAKTLYGSTVRHFVVYGDRAPPNFYIEWSDIVLEMFRNQDGSTVIRVVKGDKSSAQILDCQIAACVDKIVKDLTSQ